MVASMTTRRLMERQVDPTVKSKPLAELEPLMLVDLALLQSPPKAVIIVNQLPTRTYFWTELNRVEIFLC
uniref:Uncharacterized protein n=1 Tax=Candidozyma auris TaxID=498019 RepID=A0A0L0NRD3_CANAR